MNGRHAVALAGELTNPAVERLAMGRAVVQQIMAERWPTAAEAFLAGATPEQVAQVLGLELPELHNAISRWSAGEVREGRMTRVERDELLGLVFGARGAPGSAGPGTSAGGDPRLPRRHSPRGVTR